MSVVHPLRAWRPLPSLASRLSCPPYDVMTDEEVRRFLQASPDSFAAVVRPEVDAPAGADVHARARAALQGLQARGALVRDEGAALYVYALTWRGRRQVGVAGAFDVAAYDAGDIRRHEATREDKELERTLHGEAVEAHDEPVFLVHRAQAGVAAALQRGQEGAALYDFVAEDGVRHEVWRLGAEGTAELQRAFGAVSGLLIADGHHRSAAASRLHARRAGTPGGHGRFLAVAFADDQVTVLPYHRTVRDRRGRPPEALRAALAPHLRLSRSERFQPAHALELALCFPDGWWRGEAAPGDGEDVARGLPATVCQARVLEPVFGVHEPRTDPALHFIGGVRGLDALEAAVRAGEADVALALAPTTVAQVLAMAEAGRLMPPKSTWFEPKLRSGLLVHAFD